MAALLAIDSMTLLRGICLATGAALHVAPWPTMTEIKSSRSTLNFHIAPYASTLLNHLINGYYAVHREDKALMIHRTAGIIMNSYYVYTYLTYVPQAKLKDARNFLLRVFFILAAMVLELHALLPLLGLKALYFQKHLAFFAAMTGIGLAASPLATVGDVIRNRDSSSLPFGLCVMVTIQCTSWTIYGYLVSDWSTFANNIVGVFLGSIQLALIFSCPNRRLQKKTEEKPSRSPTLAATGGASDGSLSGVVGTLTDVEAGASSTVSGAKDGEAGIANPVTGGSLASPAVLSSGTPSTGISASTGASLSMGEVHLRVNAASVNGSGSTGDDSMNGSASGSGSGALAVGTSGGGVTSRGASPHLKTVTGAPP